jgi:Mn-dependent DtxR family transcriptional regulator
MLKYKELYDYILGVLYSLKRKKESGFFSLKDIIESLGYNSSPSEVFEIAKYLEAEGYVKISSSLGDVFVEITPNGIVYIEEKDENFMSTFEEFLKKQQLERNFDRIASRLSKSKIQQSRKTIIDKVDQLIKYLNAHKIFKKSDIFTDMKILKLELQKTDPDKEVVSIKVAKLETLSELRDQSLELKEYLYWSI